MQTANQKPETEHPQFFTAKGVAKHLGLPVTTIMKLDVPRIVLGHRTKLLKLPDVLRALEAKTQKGGRS